MRRTGSLPIISTITAIATACAMLAQPAIAHAGALTVMPIKVEVAPGNQFCSLTIGNDANQDVTVQLRGYRWRQAGGGKDVLEAAADFITNPSIVTIPAGRKQLVRCSIPPDDAAPEDTFRLLINELPRAEAEPGTLKTLLQLSIPVFRSQPGARPQLMWSRRDDDCITLTNGGTAHARILSLSARRAAAEPVQADQAFYLLAGANRQVDLCDAGPDVAGVDITLADGSVVSLDQRFVVGQ